MILIDKYKTELEIYAEEETFNIRIDEPNQTTGGVDIAHAYLTVKQAKKLKRELRRFIKQNQQER